MFYAADCVATRSRRRSASRCMLSLSPKQPATIPCALRCASQTYSSWVLRNNPSSASPFDGALPDYPQRPPSLFDLPVASGASPVCHERIQVLQIWSLGRAFRQWWCRRPNRWAACNSLIAWMCSRSLGDTVIWYKEPKTLLLFKSGGGEGALHLFGRLSVTGSPASSFQK